MKDFYTPQLAAGGLLEHALPYLENPDYIIEEKLDGHRCLLHHALDGSIKTYSRRTSIVTGLPVTKTDRVPHLIEIMRQLTVPGTVLDGEIVITDPSIPHEGRSSAVSAIMGSSAEEALAKQQDYPVAFAAFDILALKGTELLDLPLSQRKDLLANLFTNQSFESLWKLPYLQGRRVVKEHYLESIWDVGGEGVILKNIKSPYRQGKRHRDWVKVKNSLTFDCIVMDFVESSDETVKVDGSLSAAKYKGMVGSVGFGQYNAQGELVRIGQASGFTDDIRRDMTDHPEHYMGKVIVVESHQQLSSGALRHPRTKGVLRDDKNPKDCIILGSRGG